jgi:hypothetical protein
LKEKYKEYEITETIKIWRIKNFLLRLNQNIRKES